MFLGHHTDDDNDKPVLLRAVEAIVAGPKDIRKVVHECDTVVRNKLRGEDIAEADLKIQIADLIIERYARTCGRIGSLTAAAGAVPGVGFVISLVGAAAADLAITMKYQIEMTMALGHLFGRDISTEEEQQLCYAVAGLGVATQAGMLSFQSFTVKGLQEATKRLMKTRAKKWFFDLFKKLGLKVTEKGLLKAIPLGVGVALSYSSNKKLTRYIGRRARDYFIETAPPRDTPEGAEARNDGET